MADKKLTFEESMNRLEEIVRKLEKNDEPLDETIRLFEEGLGLVKSCDDRLKQFEGQVEEIIRKNEGEQDEH